MSETRRRLTWVLLALCMALALVLVPRVALGEGYEGWFGDQQEETELVSAEPSSDEGLQPASLEEDVATEPEPVKFVNGSPWYDESHAGERLLGIDVSEWNATIDWERVQASGVDFAILKCGGSQWKSCGCYSDSEFLRNAQECERLGIPYGVYFYSTAESEYEAGLEAEHVVSLLQGLKPSLPVYIDLECEWMAGLEYTDILAGVASTFCNGVEAAGYKAGVYASASWFEYLLTDPCFDQWAKWSAQYGDVCEVEDASCWQYSTEGKIDGIYWPVDLNIWFA